jgi:hypothetical protein
LGISKYRQLEARWEGWEMEDAQVLKIFLAKEVLIKSEIYPS